MKTLVQEIKIATVLPPKKSGITAEKPGPLVALVARLMDTVFTIPGTNIRFGFDPLLGLIPGFGDFAGVLVSALPILHSSRYRLPKISNLGWR